MCEYQNIKTRAEEVLGKIGAVDIHWVGPAYRVNTIGENKKVIALWFEFDDRQFFTPFAASWDKENWSKEGIDEHIASWMKRPAEDIDNYLINSPNLRYVCPKEVKCDCGAVKCNTTHSLWCSTKGTK